MPNSISYSPRFNSKCEFCTHRRGSHVDSQFCDPYNYHKFISCKNFQLKSRMHRIEKCLYDRFLRACKICEEMTGKPINPYEEDYICSLVLYGFNHELPTMRMAHLFKSWHIAPMMAYFCSGTKKGETND